MTLLPANSRCAFLMITYYREVELFLGFYSRLFYYINQTSHPCIYYLSTLCIILFYNGTSELFSRTLIYSKDYYANKIYVFYNLLYFIHVVLHKWNWINWRITWIHFLTGLYDIRSNYLYIVHSGGLWFFSSLPMQCECNIHILLW